MKKVIVRAPVRADLAGGTLDLWPLYLFHPGARTVNVAISYYAETEVVHSGDESIEIYLVGQQYRRRYASPRDLAGDPKVALIHRALEHFRAGGLRITTRTDAPRGSGLGGSSALAITLVRALSEIVDHPVEGEDLIALVRDLETRLLGLPAGIQDCYPPVYGGLGALHLNPGAPSRHTIPLPLSELTDHMVLHYSGIARFSGTNNWQMYKRHVDGDLAVTEGLDRIAAISVAMERALASGDLEAAGAALAEEWEARKALIEGISTPEIDAAISAARNAGAWGGKVCGAGGGGCVVLLGPPDRREAITRALAAVPGRVVDAVPAANGLTVDASDDSQASFSFVRGRLMARPPEAQLEQLFVYGGASGDYKPFLLAEGVVTHSEPRSGVHQTLVRSFVAPIEPSDGKVLWHHGTPMDPELLDIRAVPDPRHKLEISISPEALMQGATQSEESFRQFLEERERLHIFHNPAFGFYSEVHEDREAFLGRCLEEVTRRLEPEVERLETTFRRRIDQLRERSEREQREIEAKEKTVDEEGSGSDVNVAWGQALYNITSGKPATSDGPHSLRETDYVENIAQIQKSWDKELDALREELNAKARSIEEIIVTASPRNIEVTKFLILWATELPA
ncbi:MAG TPA: hypothetical protein VEZ11_10020 [Thermoanaerobaculia bacterium]|nr:hypothetical protein [Thermoanaerobaculia bacterium]